MFKKIARVEISAPLMLGVIFILSRILYHMAGIRFRADTITWAWHFIDIELLKNDLWRSVFYMHTQPPLLNLLTGLGLQLFPKSYALIFQTLFFLGGLALTIAIYFVAIKLGLPKSLSVVLASWFSVSPATVIFENDYFYTYPLTIVLTLSMIFLARFLEKKRAVDGIIFSLLLAASSLTWAMFHLVWLLGCFGIVFFLLKGYHRKSLWLVPAFLLVFGWYSKNEILYGSFTASSWAGLNVFKTVTVRIPGEVREQWIKEGIVSDLALVPPYRSPDVYLEYFPNTPRTGIPLLDNISLSNGYRNQHHLSYVYAGERYLRDAMRILFHAPHYYLSTIPYSLYIYLHSASDYEHTLEIRRPIDRLDTIWDRLFYGQWQKDETLQERSFSFSPDHMGWWLAIDFFIALIGAPIYLWNQRHHYQTIDYGIILFAFFTVLFVSGGGTMLEIGENNRFRFVIDPLILLIDVFLVHRAIIAFKIKPN